MNNFLEITTPFEKLVTIKLHQDGEFRPAATGDNQDQAKLRVLMERLEIEASLEQEPGFIASAAHPERNKALLNAHYEAVERVSVATWWALRQPAVAKAPESLLDLLSHNHPTKENISVSIGYIRAVGARGLTAVSILEDSAAYPYAVLGAAYHPDHTAAAHKAFIESVQSWTASVWIRNKDRKNTPFWDAAELQRRAQAIRLAPVYEDQITLNYAEFTPIESRSVTTEFGENHIAWVYGNRPISGSSTSLARLAVGTTPFKVFTEHAH